MSILTISGIILLFGVMDADISSEMTLWYASPADAWVEALPLGNGRIGGMAFGGVAQERVALNEDSLWSGGPQDADNPEALEALPEIRRLLFAGKVEEAERLANKKLVCKGAGSGLGNGAYDPYGSYQALGDLRLFLNGEGAAEEYRRSLDLSTGVARVTYTLGGTD